MGVMYKMKLLIVGDTHYSQYSSIIRKRGEIYSQRLENLLWSINWAEQTAIKSKVDKIIYLGDFFDRADLNAEELTAFKDIVWAKDIPHIFLVGNHEVGARTLKYSSVHFLEALGENFKIIDEPTYECGFGYRFFYLPYIFENDRKSIKEYKNKLTATYCWETNEVKKDYIFSHNDLKGIQYGCIESKEGFEIEDILNNCQLFINGHIHNGSWVKKDRILNLGNLTGQNFNEDGYEYIHNILYLDTDTDEIILIPNHYAFNFIKLEVDKEEDIDKLDILPNSVISLKCKESLVPELRRILDDYSDVKEYRITSVADINDVEENTTVEFNSIDHLQQFQEYIINQLGKTDAVIKELIEVLK